MNPFKPITTESAALKQILQYLRTKGYLCWRNNTGAYAEASRFIRFGKVGSGDILGLTKEGKFFSIEVKRMGKKPSPPQAQFMEQVKSLKGIAFIAYEIEDVIKNGL